MAVVNTSGIARITMSSFGIPTNGTLEFTSDISGTGRYVVFGTTATNLAPGDTGSGYNVYLRDTVGGTTVPISLTPAGEYTHGSYQPSVSDDGRYVAFRSDADLLVSDDTNGLADVFVRDLLTGGTTRLSIAGLGEGDGASTSPVISGDGRFVAFHSGATNLVNNDTNGMDDVFVSDRLTGSIRRVSVSTSGRQGDSYSVFSDISKDGRFVAFEGQATNLVSHDTNGLNDIFLHDTVLGTTVRVSVSSSEAQGNGSTGASGAALSATGRFVVFQSDASNLAAGDTSVLTDVYLRDVSKGTTERISVSTSGVGGNGESRAADVSADGRFVVFESDATNLVTGDGNEVTDIFLRDRVAGTTVRLSVGLGGTEANSYSMGAHISGDGRFVTFHTGADNLIPGDVNGAADILRVSLFATSSADYLIGSDGADTIRGLGGADVVSTGLGADTLDGGAGADTMSGGYDGDTYTVDNLGDRVVELNEPGYDRVNSAVSFSLAGQLIELLALTGKAAVDGTGNSLDNRIGGNDAANNLDGGKGLDQLTGYGGKDHFVVSTAPSATNHDTITDMNGDGNDTLWLANSAFRKLAGTNHNLGADEFWVNNTGKAHDNTDRIIYDKDDGNLYYDANGDASGGGLLFAHVDKNLTLTTADFHIF